MGRYSLCTMMTAMSYLGPIAAGAYHLWNDWLMLWLSAETDAAAVEHAVASYHSHRRSEQPQASLRQAADKVFIGQDLGSTGVPHLSQPDHCKTSA